MLQSNQVEELITAVSELDRGTLVEQFRRYPASFKVDFSQDFLERQSLDRLRHIFVALCIQQKHMPRI